MIRVFVIRGGLWGPDGPWTSAGMDGLANEISKLPNVEVSTFHNWSDAQAIADEVVKVNSAAEIAIVGFSGGGSRATLDL